MNDEQRSTRPVPDVEARIAGLSPEKRALLRARIARRESVVADQQAPPASHAAVEQTEPPARAKDDVLLPRNEVEQGVAEIWCELLRQSPIGIDENFFELGGHSLLAIQLMSRLRHRFQVELSVNALFEFPTIAALAVHLGAAMGSGGRAGAMPIVPAPLSTDMPLSFAQQRLWFMEQWEGNDALYNMASAWWLEGSLELERLRGAFDKIVARHEALRTAFVNTLGEPRQEVLAGLALEVPCVDLRELPIEQARSRALAQAQALFVQDFRLDRPPLLRVALYRVADSSHLLVLVMHHIVSDGWSMPVLCRELSAIYAGRDEDLPVLSAQYPDYANWQRSELQGAALERQLDYWRHHLADLTTLELPTDRPRPPMQSYRGARHPVALSPALSAALRQTCQREKVTLYQLLLAAFQALLHRYSGQDDITVGTPFAGRTRREFEDLIGFFVNTLVLRTDVSGNPSFRELLARVRTTALESYANQDVPFERLVEELSSERDLSRNPLFQVVFVLQESQRRELELAELAVKPQDLDTAVSKFDLTLELTEKDTGLVGEFRYATDLFDAATIARLAGHFSNLLEGIVADPTTPVSELPLLSAAERRQLLVQWNQTVADYPSDRCIHQLFEEQVRTTPDATALVFENTSLTYTELNERANQLAHHLIALGVGPDVPVGICLERSLELEIGLLGILKAGGAYVPLDPDYPSARLSFVLTDTAAPVLLTAHALLGRLPPFEGQTLCLDRDWPRVTIQPRTDPPARASATNLAYIIHTSGSTGTPKGVMIEHRSLANFIESRRIAFAIDARDTLLQLTSISFDPASWECFATLLVGGRLVMAPPGAKLYPSLVIATLLRHDVTVFGLGPSFLRVLVREPGLAECRKLTRVNCGGEVLPADLARTFLTLSGARLYNSYGPTETTISVLRWECQRDEARATVPIGRPIANTQVYVLDRNRQPVPVGVAGELYVGGDAVGRGYWQRPDLTAERFVPDPFHTDAAARLYRTGDRARWLADGTIEFLGRLDHQVKLRGFRIELGEIEATLAAQPQVSAAVVAVREDTPGDQRLVAYYVSALEPVPESEVGALRAALKRALPDYMIPSAFVVLPALPLTPNGKIDRKALPAPERQFAQDPADLPRNPVEEMVAGIWCDLLHLERVGVEENFFELGGHSLLATQMLARLTRALGVELSLRSFFAQPTVAALATAASKRLEAEGSSELAPIALVPRSGPLPLSFAQQRLWFLDRLQPNQSTYNIPAAWRLLGELDREALARSLDALVARHEALRTRFAIVDGDPAQIIDEAHPGALRFTDLGTMAAAERSTTADRITTAEARQPFDLARGPLLRAQLVRLGADEHLLLVTVHHIATDGWSTAIIERELSAAYRAFAAGQEPRLPALPIQYADYALWQRQHQQGQMLEGQLDYWKTRLAQLPVLALPTDRPPAPLPSHNGGHFDLVLPPALTGALKAVGRAEGATLFMTLLAAFQVLLSRYSGQEDLAVGTPVAGRGRTELDGLIGFFVNTLVMRADLSGDPGFREVLGRVRDGALEAYAHQDVPFERLVEVLAPGRDPSRNPLFQVMFSLQNAPEAGLALGDVAVSRLPIQGDTAKFDLGLSARESEQGLHMSWEYATDLFDAATVARMAAHFSCLLEGIVARPQAPVTQLPLLGPAERHQLLVAWNDTTTDYPRERCIHALFEEQAARTPDAVALVFEDQQLSYAELNSRANQLAHHLIALGVGPGMPVGICLERSFELIVGVLGILKAGGAYVPLDPDYPAQRLAFMLADTAAPVLLTQQGLLDQMPQFAGHTLCLDRDRRILAAQPDSNPACHVASDSCAYIVYTSGSTGQPKGVAVPHRGVLRLVLGTDYVRFGAEQRFLLLSSISFDAFTFEAWGPLLHGSACVVMPDRVPTFEALEKAVRQQHVDTMFLTTSLFNVVIDEAPETLIGVRQLLTGGEAASVAHVRRALARLPGLELTNVYGPTESTTFACCHRISRPLPEALASIPIGRPIANTRAYVLDRMGEPCPIGVAGELYLGGDGLASGYLGRPELTAERFLPDPHDSRPDARMYRTGDRVRLLADGTIEFLGRIDEQIKIRGFRIELGEIEAALLEHPTVRQAAVAMREDVPGDKRLVAYLVAEGEAPSASELRAALKLRLPAYMLPSAYVVLERLPLTSNGKIDRALLPSPSAAAQDSAAHHASPRDQIERRLCAIWSEFLGVKDIGIDDNFFDLGGHSILAARMFARLDRSLGRSLPLATLFRSPTVRELARHYRETVESAAGVALVPITTGGSLPPLFAVPGVGGNVLGFATLARDLGSEQPFFGLQSIGLDGSAEPLESIEDMAERYLREVRQVQPQGPYRLLGVCFGATVAFEMAHQLLGAGEEVAFLGLVDPSSRGGELSANPPSRLPAWLKRDLDFGRFATNRLRLYREQMRALGFRDRMRFLRDKLQIVGAAVEKRDVFRGDHREFNQQRVYDANLRALLRYRHTPLGGAPIAIEIFQTARERDPASLNRRVDWSILTGGSVPVHPMPGKDSGDMLRAGNAMVLASSLRASLERLP